MRALTPKAPCQMVPLHHAATTEPNRERALKDVITQLEPGLFKKVTGLTQKDFERLVSLGVFNSALMNDAVYKFKRYEDASLSYTGVNKHEGEPIGLFDTVLSPEEAEFVYQNQPIDD